LEIVAVEIQRHEAKAKFYLEKPEAHTLKQYLPHNHTGILHISTALIPFPSINLAILGSSITESLSSGARKSHGIAAFVPRLQRRKFRMFHLRQDIMFTHYKRLTATLYASSKMEIIFIGGFKALRYKSGRDYISGTKTMSISIG
jgi:hypothetical protein